MSMDSKSEVNRKFGEIVAPQVIVGIAKALNDFLLAAPGGQHTPSDATLQYVIDRLWTNRDDPRSST